MLNFGWAELLVIGLVALIVIGPEDLPDMFRQLGRFTAKLRSMSREFSRAMEQAAKDSGVKDVAKDLKGMTSAKSMGLDAVKASVDKFEKWDPIKNAAKPTVTAKPLVPPPMPATPAPKPAPEIMVSDADEAADDLADHDAPEVEQVILPPVKKPAVKRAKVASAMVEPVPVKAAPKPRKTAKKAETP
jgi:sec-independent protein translocase protein TatB